MSGHEVELVGTFLPTHRYKWSLHSLALGTRTRAAAAADISGGQPEDDLLKVGVMVEQRGTGSEIGQFGGR
jgi:hypothetical protein